MSINGLLAAPLSDGRLQIWLSQSGKLFTLWKEGTDPDSAWTRWQVMPASTLGVTLGCAAPLPNKALQLFVIANAGFNPPYQTGPGVETTWKVSHESTAAWSDWKVFWAGESAVGGGAGATSLAAAPLTDGRIQVFFVVSGAGGARLKTAWKATTEINSRWTAVVDFNLGTIDRPEHIAAGRLSDGRIQLFLTTGSALLSTWKETTHPDSAWLPWQRFYRNTGDDIICTAPLPDRRLQLWRFNRAGALWSCWKETTHPDAAWTDWSVFPAPGAGVVAFEAAPLSDGRLQLWSADSHGALFTTWKATTHPDAAWLPWARFPSP